MNSPSNEVLTVSPFAIAVGLLLCAGNAGAVSASRNFAQNATGACQAALPAFEGNIRKRLLVVSNDGASTAVVTCSLMGTSQGEGDLRSIYYGYVYLDNYNASPVGVTCTLADGYSGTTYAYQAKTSTLAPTSKLNPFLWLASADNGGQNYFYAVNVTCALPPGTAISLTLAGYYEDVGL